MVTIDSKNGSQEFHEFSLRQPNRQSGDPAFRHYNVVVCGDMHGRLL